MNVTPLRPAASYDLRDVALISGSSLIYSPQLTSAQAPFPLNTDEDLLQEEVVSRMQRRSTNGKLDFTLTRTVEHVGHLKPLVVPLNLIHTYNYFHFLIESLPGLVWMLDNQMIDTKAMIVSGMLHPNMWTALAYIMGTSPIATLSLRVMQSVTCDRILTAPPTAHASQLVQGGTSDWAFDPARLRGLRARFAPLMADNGQPRRKLYVRRVSAARALTNASEVEAAARAAGYTIVQPEGLSFIDQVKVFSHASHIIGPTGAWAANLLFAPQDAKIAIFYPDTIRVEKQLWSTMAEALEMQASTVYCPVTLLRPEPYTIHSDFMIPLELLGDLLRQGA